MNELQSQGTYRLASCKAQLSPHTLKPLWQEVLMLTKEPFPTEHLIEECEEHLDKGHLARLYRWVEFLNEQYLNMGSVYSPLLFSLLEAIHTNKLLSAQTSHQFETSRDFLRSMFKEDLQLMSGDEDAPVCLLQLALIVGKYPGMIRCRKGDAFKVLQGGVGEHSLREVFCKLYVKYKAPQPLLDWVFHLNEK